MVLGGLLVVPVGLLAAMTGRPLPTPRDRRRHAGRGRRAPAPSSWRSSAASASSPTDREFEKLGYDIESRVPGTGQAALHRGQGPRRGRRRRSPSPRTRSSTRSTSRTTSSWPSSSSCDGDAHRVHYLRRPFQREPDFGVTSVNYDFAELLGRAGRHPDEQTDAHDRKTAKKLIEVALPLEAINKASAREKSIRHGHPSTLHLWWARRPLAAARAVIFAQMVDDPSSTWTSARTRSCAGGRDALKAAEALGGGEPRREGEGPAQSGARSEPTLDECCRQERQRLFRIIEDLVLWENTTNETVLQAARDEIWAQLAPHLRRERRPSAGQGAVRPPQAARLPRPLRRRRRAAAGGAAARAGEPTPAT